MSISAERDGHGARRRIRRTRPVHDESPVGPRLVATRAAFDSVAADYDGPRGNNELIQDMRSEMWRWLDRTFEPGSHLLDIGCGTGLDAVRLAKRGHRITATDFSPRMVERTRSLAEHERVADRVTTAVIGAHELGRLAGRDVFDGAYSDLGALNCVPDLEDTARECARLVRPGGSLVFTVIGRLCPWEIAHYLARGNWARLKVRFARDAVPVGLAGGKVWTRYYTPRSLYRAFARDFRLVDWRGLCTFVPPPYLCGFRQRWPRAYALLWRLDRRTAGWPLLRMLGDHFLIVMSKR